MIRLHSDLYPKDEFRKSLDSIHAGIKINYNIINNLPSADDIVLIARSLPELHSLTDLIV